MKSEIEQNTTLTPNEFRTQPREIWAGLLLHPTNPRRDARGRTVHQVLSDTILQNFEADRASMH